MLHDNQELFFRNKEEFLQRLTEVQNNTVWKNIPVANLYVGPAAQNTNEADIDTHRNGTNWFAGEKYGYHYTGVRECALRSLYDRLGLGGSILQRLDKSAMEELIHFAIKHPTEDTLQIPVVEGKVNAFLSSQYVKLPSNVVFEELVNFLQSTFDQEDFRFNGRWTYYESAGTFELPISKVIDGKPFKVKLTCKTSDAGYSSVNFSAVMQCGSTVLPIMSDISLTHKGKLSEEKLRESLNQIEGVIDKGVKKLSALLSIYINNPKSTMKRLAKEVGLPKREILEVIDGFEERGMCTAFECYMTLAGIIDDTLTWTQRERYQGNLYKLLGISWERFDLPGEFAW